MADKEVKVSKIKNWSPVWIIPIVTGIIGIILLLNHINNKGVEITLKTRYAEGIIPGKTMIKSRSVNVGIVDGVALSDDFQTVIITGTINKEMSGLLKKDTVFWLVRPQIGRDGISGLNTIISGSYIELGPGVQDKTGEVFHEYDMLDAPPRLLNASGKRIILNSTLPNVLEEQTPVKYRGYEVGMVEKAEFDLDKRGMRYTVFIHSPYDSFITNNVRFWQEGGIAVSLTAQGVEASFPSLSTLLNGGVSFDLPEGQIEGNNVADGAEFMLFASKQAINEKEYTVYKEYILPFSTSISGLEVGSPVMYRGVRIGTVTQAPYMLKNSSSFSMLSDSIYVLIKIEPERVAVDEVYDFSDIDELISSQKLRASLKNINFLTGAMVVDLDFYSRPIDKTLPKETNGYNVIATVDVGFTQIQNQITEVLEKLEKMPVENTLGELDRTLQSFSTLLGSVDSYVQSGSVQNLPSELEKTLQEIRITLAELQAGTEITEDISGNLMQLEKVLREFESFAQTLNSKSNALIFKANTGSDIEPKKGGLQ